MNIYKEINKYFFGEESPAIHAQITYYGILGIPSLLTMYLWNVINY